MARSPEVISSVIDEQLTTRLSAQGITLSPSAVAEWKLWRDLFADSVNAFETIQDIFKSDVEEYLKSKQPGSNLWYVSKALEFQYGDSLLVSDDGILYYPEINTAKQIVKQASAVEVDNSGYRQLLVKIAKEISGSFTPLSDTEKLAFTNYFEVVKFVGTSVIVVSQNADIINYNLEVKFNGIFAESDMVTKIEAALTAFKRQIRFDAIFYASSLLDAVLAVPGVVAAKFNSLTGTPYGGSPTAITLGYELQSGYFNYHASSELNLSIA